MNSVHQPSAISHQLSPPDREWFEKWRGSHYDPQRGEVVICGEPPRIVIEHEYAHSTQHALRTWRWRVWSAAHRLNACTGRFTRLLRWAHLRIELDAHQRATRALRASGLTRADARAIRMMFGELMVNG